MKINLSPPHQSGTEIDFILSALESNFIAPVGPQLNEFEAVVSNYLGDDVYCVALNSGTAAMHLALLAAGIGNNDIVWTQSMTFAGGVFPIVYVGAVPSFFDCSTSSWSLDPDILEDELIKANKYNRLPKAIVATDLYGQPADVLRLESIAASYSVKLIFDSAESFGAVTNSGRKAGSCGDASIISFNGNKIITTSGGGMFVTKHADWADNARFLATQAKDIAPHYQHSSVGYNYRMSNISAAIGLAQFSVLEDRVMARRRIFDVYQRNLECSGFNFMPEGYNSFSTRWLTAATVDAQLIGVKVSDIISKLLGVGIEVRPIWKPMHLQPIFQSCKYYGAGHDEKIFNSGLCLPSGSALPQGDQATVISTIKEIIKN